MRILSSVSSFRSSLAHPHPQIHSPDSSFPKWPNWLYFLSLKALALGVLCHCGEGTLLIERVIHCCCGSEINGGLTDLPAPNVPLFHLPQSSLSGFEGPSHQITT